MTDNEIIKECRKKGLQNGSTIGLHSGFMDIVADRFEELLIENERLETENKCYAELEQGCYVTGYKNIKAEAYKECIEKIKEEIYTVGFDLDNLLKEMVGE